MKKVRFLVGLYFFFVFLISGVFALEPQIEIDETSTLTDLNNGQYSLSASGTIEITNPSAVSKIYEVTIPLNLDSLLGISKVSIDATSDKISVDFEKIKGYLIEPNETVTVGYKIFGLLSSNIYNSMPGSESIFEYYSHAPELSGKTLLNLQKPEREGLVYNSSGDLVENNAAYNSSRFVTAGIRNPTEFDYRINELKLYRTLAATPFFSSGDQIATFFNITVNPFGFEEVDFEDKGSVNNSVYWMSAEVLINTNLTSSFTRSFKAFSSSSGGGGGGGGGGFFGTPSEDSGVLDTLLIKKTADKIVIQNGDEFKVILRVINVNDFVLEDLVIADEIPENYELKDVSTQVKIDQRELEFTIDEVGSYETFVITYTLVNKNEFSGVTFLKPSRLDYDGNSYYSEGVLLINDLLPEQKVFVQKEIDYVDDQFARVTIKVKNLGTIALEDLLISDDIPNEALIREISQIFEERGLWKIKKLKSGEEWEVSYIVERNPALDNLPNVFGVDQENVFGTLVSGEEIITIFQGKPRVIEKVGLGLAVGLLIVYLLF